MEACNGCHPVPVDTIILTSTNGTAFVNWQLGTTADSNQSLTAKIRGGSNLSVTFKATTRYFKLHNFVGTINISGDTGIAPGTPFSLPYGGITPYQVNTNMPLEMDIMSLDVNQYLISPQSIIMNGDTILRNSKNPVGCCDFYGGTSYQSVDTSYDYMYHWIFTGTVTNNIYSGTYQNIVVYYVTPPPPASVLRGQTIFNGIFIITQQ
jgi:hypothetical protein